MAVPDGSTSLREQVEHAVSRTTLAGHVGKSGAGLERVVLTDGRRLVVKRVSSRDDLLMASRGERVGSEYVAWSTGLLHRLPSSVGHPVVGAWLEGGTTVVVMRDLGDTVLSWEHRLDRSRVRWMVRRVADLHLAFLGQPVEGLTPLAVHLALFSPARMQPHVDDDNPLAAAALRGWELFGEQVPHDVAEAVNRLLEDPGPLAEALLRRPSTLLHGDLATVNMAFEGDRLVLIDWAMAVRGPGALDVARFVAGCSQVVDASREDVLSEYAHALGPAHDERAMRLALLAGLVWLGWNKALDAALHPDPDKRDRERADLAWWVSRARTALETDLT
jgi:hypothetical protein